MDFTYYNRITRDLIIPLSVSLTSGYSNFYANVGKSEIAMELQVSGSPVRNEHFSWNIVVNYAANRSKLLSLNIPNNPAIDRYILAEEEIPCQQQPLSVSAICFNRNRLYLPEWRESNNRCGSVCSFSRRKGNWKYTADFVGGVTNSFSFKGFTLSALVDFRKRQFLLYTNMYGLYSGIG